MNNARAQSEVLGTLLLVSVVTIAISLVGVTLLGSLTQSTEAPQSNIKGELTDSELELVHRGGDSLQQAELDVRIANASNTSTVAFVDGEIVSGTPNQQFQQGDRWRLSGVQSGAELDVWLYHTPTGAVIYRETLYRE